MSSREVRPGDLLNRALRMLAEQDDGTVLARRLRAELVALATARRGRLVVTGEDRRCVSAFVVALLSGVAPAGLVRLPASGVVIRHDTEPFVRQLGEQPATPLEIGMPHPFLRDHCIVVPATLGAPGTKDDVGVTTMTSVVLVTAGRTPLSRAEASFLERAARAGARCCVVSARTGRPNATAVAAASAASVGEISRRARHEILFGAADVVEDVTGDLVQWLYDARPADVAREQVAVVQVALDGWEPAADGSPDPRRSEAADDLAEAEARIARATKVSTSWLATLGFEVGRIRADGNEELARALREVEDRFGDMTATAPLGDLDILPGEVLERLRLLERAARERVHQRLLASERRILGTDADVAGLGAPSRPRQQGSAVELVSVAAVQQDSRSELMSRVGNFSSGRQSVSLLGALGTAVGGPLTVVGAALGFGFVQMGRKTREDAQLRAVAARWVHAQVAEAGRVIRHAVEQDLSNAQLELNLAAREYVEREMGDARRDLAAAQSRVVAAQEADATFRAAISGRQDKVAGLRLECADLLAGEARRHDLQPVIALEATD